MPTAIACRTPIGLHAWQVLPLFVPLVRGGSDRTRTAIALAAAGVYAAVFGLARPGPARPARAAAPRESNRRPSKGCSMAPDQIFAIVVLLAALSWLALIVVPRRAAAVTGFWCRAICRWALCRAHRRQLERRRRRLLHPAGGRAAVRQPLAAAGRLGALPCFDLLIGTWEVHDAQARGIPPAGRSLPHPHVPVRPGGLAAG
jgi:hypothetical protein